MRKVALISILASLLIAAPAFAQKSDCGRNQPCGQVPWQLPYLPPLLSPSPMPTIVTTPLPPVFTGTPEATVTLTATLAPTPTPDVRELNVTTFTQTLGSEIIANGNMETGNPPTSWGPGGSILSRAAEQRPGGTGSYSLNIARDNNNNAYAQQIPTVVQGGWYQFNGWWRNVDAIWSAYLRTTGGPDQTSIQDTNTAWREWHNLTQRTSNSAFLRCYVSSNVDGHSARCDDLSFKRVNVNAQQTMPDSDGELTFYFSLPGSPVAGDALHLIYRIADGTTIESASSSYWDAYLLRNQANTQWDFNLDSVNAGTRTTRTSASNVGSPDAIRVVLAGTTHNASTREGGVFTARGSQVTLDHLTTARGLNTVYNPGFTPSQLFFTNTIWGPTAIPGTTIPEIPLDTSGIADQLATLGALTDGDSMTITDLEGNPINLEEQFAQLATPAGMFFGYARGLSEINLGTITTFLSFALLTVAIIVALTAADFLLPIIATAFGVIRRVASLILDFLPL